MGQVYIYRKRNKTGHEVFFKNTNVKVAYMTKKDLEKLIIIIICS